VFLSFNSRNNTIENVMAWKSTKSGKWFWFLLLSRFCLLVVEKSTDLCGATSKRQISRYGNNFLMTAFMAGILLAKIHGWGGG
jgi:hypothetical protein